MSENNKNETIKSKNKNLMYLIILCNSILFSLIGFLGWKFLFSGEEKSNDLKEQTKDKINNTNNESINSLDSFPTVSKNPKLIGVHTLEGSC